MPRFFFHSFDRHGSAVDAEGVELPDTSVARRIALEGARALICDDVRSGVLDLTGSIEVSDEAGNPVLSLPFTQAVHRFI
jgi:hypothetical protein